MIECGQLREHVIRPILRGMNAWSQAAENLLLGTAAQESHMGRYLVQIKGPALGIFQMEPATYQDHWWNFLRYREGLSARVRQSTGVRHGSAEHMIGNLYYAAAMARVHYLRVPEALPKSDDLEALAGYWKQHFNTKLGSGTAEEFKRNYIKFVR